MPSCFLKVFEYRENNYNCVCWQIFYSIGRIWIGIRISKILILIQILNAAQKSTKRGLKTLNYSQSFTYDFY